MSKLKTKAQLDKAADARLRKAYNITLKDYAYLERQSEGKCWISDRPPGTRRLHVDHDHSWKKVKIETLGNRLSGWAASATYNGVCYVAGGPKKSLAVRALKQKLLRASIRGLLSYNMNTGIQKFSDDPALLRAAADYLENFRKKSPLTGRMENA